MFNSLPEMTGPEPVTQAEFDALAAEVGEPRHVGERLDRRGVLQVEVPRQRSERAQPPRTLAVAVASRLRGSSASASWSSTIVLLLTIAKPSPSAWRARARVRPPPPPRARTCARAPP